MNLLNEYVSHKLTCKVDVVLGENDKIVTDEELKEFVGYLQNGSFHILPNTKHPLDKVNMSQLAELIKKLVTKY